MDYGESQTAENEDALRRLFGAPAEWWQVKRRVVVHRQIYRKGAFGGTLNTTLCGRSQLLRDGTNCSERDEEVTCKFCLKRAPLTKLAKER